MRVLLNGVASLKPKTGIGHYIESLYEHLPVDDTIFFPGPWARGFARRFFKPGSGKAKKRSWLKGPSKLVRRAGLAAMRRMFRTTASRSGCDLYHEPNYVPWDCDLPVVATIHDLSVLLYPEWHPADRVTHFETNFRDGLARCRHLITDCASVRREVIQTLGIEPERISTVRLGVRAGFRPLDDDEIQGPLADYQLTPGYLLHVGTIEPRKNLLILMQAYVDLPRELRERHPLVLIGGWGWRTEKIRDYYEGTARHQGVVHIGYAAEEHLPALYNGARALVFPSHYEGFGFPPLEMMACGGAVLASSATAVREIMPASADSIHPEDIADWRNAMHRTITNDEYWNHSRSGVIEHARSFTWERCARETQAVYQNVLREPIARAA